MKGDFDVAVVGSGFAGSLLAMIARASGRSVVLLERGAHPRFVIGESSTPLANLLLEELSVSYGLKSVRPLAQWGTWQAACPQIGCGLKRGFTFYHHRFGQQWDGARGRQLLVGASPHDRVADTHWYRQDLDEYLVREAQALGVEYLDRVHLRSLAVGPPATLEGDRGSRSVRLKARLVVDASGPRGCLHHLLRLPEARLRRMPSTQVLFSHFERVHSWPELGGEPYPPNDAAVHHVFPGGWIWVLRFNNGITSAGVAATSRLAAKVRLAEGEPAWQRLLDRLPGVAPQFREARPTFPFRHQGKIPFRSKEVTGPGWALLPSAAGFIDPMLSTGFPLTLLGVERLGRLIAKHWNNPALALGLDEYARATQLELLACERLLAALYAKLNDFELFAALTRIYFAASSFTETARRLNRPELAGPVFLCSRHPKFGPGMRVCLGEITAPRHGWTRQRLLNELRLAIEPIDIAGLSDDRRRNWYPVCPQDLFNGADKLRCSREEIERMLKQIGL